MSEGFDDELDGFEAYRRYVNPTLAQFLSMVGRNWKFVRAEGCRLFTEDQQGFDDWLAGFGALPLGHNSPIIRAAIEESVRESSPNLFAEVFNPVAGTTAYELLRSAGWTQGQVHFCNSGSEAVESMIKCAVAATGRKTIAYVDGGYHGATLGALGCMARGVYRDPFEKVVPVFESLAFDDVAAVEALHSRDDIAGILVEPIQVESGVRAPSAEYLAALRQFCTTHGAMLLMDEVQTGLGRTGRMWAWQHTDVKPDAFATAKGLGGGMVAIGAAVIAEGWWHRAFGAYDRAEIHASTMGGNALACKVACCVLSTIGDREFLERVNTVSAALWASLRARVADNACVQEVRSFGLLGGIRFANSEHPWLTWESMGMPAFSTRPTSGPIVIERLARHKVLTQVCGHDWATVRVEPPLIVDAAACDRFVSAVGDAADFLDRTQ